MDLSSCKLQMWFRRNAWIYLKKKCKKPLVLKFQDVPILIVLLIEVPTYCFLGYYHISSVICGVESYQQKFHYEIDCILIRFLKVYSLIIIIEGLSQNFPLISTIGRSKITVTWHALFNIGWKNGENFMTFQFSTTEICFWTKIKCKKLNTFITAYQLNLLHVK